MPMNNDTLIRLKRDWISFLKNNQIVNFQSEKSTGNLIYKRNVTPDDLSRFLRLKTDFSEDIINSAIQDVLDQRSVDPKSQKQPPPGDPKSKNQFKDDISDVNYRDVPKDVRNIPAITHRTQVDEEIKDSQNIELSEKDVESVFYILANGRVSVSQISASNDKNIKESELERIKHLIRKKMSDRDRRILWRALNDL